MQSSAVLSLLDMRVCCGQLSWRLCPHLHLTGPSCQNLDPSLSCLFGQEVAITGEHLEL